jgi:hypothetical protein
MTVTLARQNYVDYGDSALNPAEDCSRSAFKCTVTVIPLSP